MLGLRGSGPIFYTRRKVVPVRFNKRLLLIQRKPLLQNRHRPAFSPIVAPFRLKKSALWPQGGLCLTIPMSLNKQVSCGFRGIIWQDRLKPVFWDIWASQGPNTRRIFVMNPVDTFGKIWNPDLLPILVRFWVQKGTEDIARRAHNLHTSKTSSNELEKNAPSENSLPDTWKPYFWPILFLFRIKKDLTIYPMGAHYPHTFKFVPLLFDIILVILGSKTSQNMALGR